MPLTFTTSRRIKIVLPNRKAGPHCIIAAPEVTNGVLSLIYSLVCSSIPYHLWSQAKKKKKNWKYLHNLIVQS